jgi:hypothetical protein
MLETAMEELFVHQTEGQRYLERESASLGQLYSNLLSNFTRYHARIDDLQLIMHMLIIFDLTGTKPKGQIIHV